LSTASASSIASTTPTSVIPLHTIAATVAITRTPMTTADETANNSNEIRKIVPATIAGSQKTMAYSATTNAQAPTIAAWPIANARATAISTRNNSQAYSLSASAKPIQTQTRISTSSAKTLAQPTPTVTPISNPTTTINEAAKPKSAATTSPTKKSTAILSTNKIDGNVYTYYKLPAQTTTETAAVNTTTTTTITSAMKSESNNNNIIMQTLSTNIKHRPFIVAPIESTISVSTASTTTTKTSLKQPQYRISTQTQLYLQPSELFQHFQLLLQ
jgi:hypothetical protein